eukprot:scaffold269076_cov18-Tisochrysis_lutea.AAC.1
MEVEKKSMCLLKQLYFCHALTSLSFHAQDHFDKGLSKAENIFLAAANTSYYIIYEIEGGCGSGEVAIEAVDPP